MWPFCFMVYNVFQSMCVIQKFMAHRGNKGREREFFWRAKVGLMICVGASAYGCTSQAAAFVEFCFPRFLVATSWTWGNHFFGARSVRIHPDSIWEWGGKNQGMKQKKCFLIKFNWKIPIDVTVYHFFELAINLPQLDWTAWLNRYWQVSSLKKWHQKT